MTKMRMIVPTAALASLALLGVAAGHAHAQENCDWYAKTAVRQQQDNETKKCGFTGQSWHKNLDAHLKWCAGVGPAEWKAEAQKRSQQLVGCEKR